MLKKLLIKDKHYQHIRLNCEIFLKENLLSRPKNSPNNNKRKNKKDAKSENGDKVKHDKSVLWKVKLSRREILVMQILAQQKRVHY